MIDPAGHATDVVITDLRVQLGRAQRAFVAMQEELLRARYITSLLVGALEKFGRHLEDCAPGEQCTCGFAGIVTADDQPPQEQARIISDV